MNDQDFLNDLFAKTRATEPYIANDDFTSRVMGTLPQQQTVPAWLNYSITVLFALLGLALAASILPWGAISLPQQVSFNISPLTIGVALAVVSAGCLGSWWYVEKKPQ